MALLGHWRLGETSGTTVAATVGSAGTFYGDTDIQGVGAGNGPDGSNIGITLDKTNTEWINIGANSLNGKTAYTVCFWMKSSDSTSSNYTGVFGFNSSSPATALTMEAPASGPTVMVALAKNTYGQVTGTYTAGSRWWANGVWRHFAVIAASGSRGITIYVDGVAVNSPSTVTFSMQNTTQEWAIGATKWSGSPTTTFDGSFADFRIYDTDESANLATIMADLPAANPAITSATITGTSQVGQTLTANVVTDQDPVDSVAYQWEKASDGSGTGAADISGATSSTLALTYAELGSLLDAGDAYVRFGAIATKNSLPSDEDFSAWQQVTIPSGGGLVSSPLKSPFLIA